MAKNLAGACHCGAIGVVLEVDDDTEPLAAPLRLQLLPEARQPLRLGLVRAPHHRARRARAREPLRLRPRDRDLSRVQPLRAPQSVPAGPGRSYVGGYVQISDCNLSEARARSVTVYREKSITQPR